MTEKAIVRNISERTEMTMSEHGIALVTRLVGGGL